MVFSSRFTIYDFLAILIPGLLLLILLGTYCGCGSIFVSSEVTNNVWFIAFVVILSYILGLLWHKISECIFRKFRNSECIIKQQYELFISEYEKVSRNKTPKIHDNFKHEYYKAYYRLMRANCMNNIPVLEAQVAFIRNLIFIIPFYIIVLLHNDNAICCAVKLLLNNTLCLILLLFVALVGMLCLFMNIQNKIYYLVWEGNEYLPKEKNN
jgi:hypothetical protein